MVGKVVRFVLIWSCCIKQKSSIHVHFMCLCHKPQRFFTFPAGLQPMAFCPWQMWCVALKISSVCCLYALFLLYTASLLTVPWEAMDPVAIGIPCEVSSYRHSQSSYMFSALTSDMNSYDRVIDKWTQQEALKWS